MPESLGCGARKANAGARTQTAGLLITKTTLGWVSACALSLGADDQQAQRHRRLQDVLEQSLSSSLHALLLCMTTARIPSWKPEREQDLGARLEKEIILRRERIDAVALDINSADDLAG